MAGRSYIRARNKSRPPGAGPEVNRALLPCIRRLAPFSNEDGAEECRHGGEIKDLPALVKANGQLVEAWENCQKESTPDFPSEGIKHPPRTNGD